MCDAKEAPDGGCIRGTIPQEDSAKRQACERREGLPDGGTTEVPSLKKRGNGGGQGETHTGATGTMEA